MPIARSLRTPLNAGLPSAFPFEEGPSQPMRPWGPALVAFVLFGTR